MATAAAESRRHVRYVDTFRAGPVERIEAIRAGVPAREAKALTGDLGIDQAVMFKALGLKTATVNRKVAQGAALAPDESERVLGLARLVGQVRTMVEESGNAEEFDAASWLGRWLRQPVPALGDVEPLGFLDTMEGQAILSRTLAQMQGASYA